MYHIAITNKSHEEEKNQSKTNNKRKQVDAHIICI